MNKTLVFTLLATITLISAGCQNASALENKPVSHPFICADYGGNMIRMVSQAGDIEWEYPVISPQDLWQLSNGNILFTWHRGVKEITLDKKIVWEYETEKPNEVHSCQPLANGTYMVAVSGPCEILEIDRNGKNLKTVKLTTNQKNPHAQMRIARKLKNGNYLVGHNSDGVVREYDTNGKVIRIIKVEGNPYAGYRLPNGNTIISCGDGHKLIEVDANDNIVWQLEENDLPGNPLRFVAGIQRLPNGNTVVCNWGGHGHVGEQPQIFEVTPDKNVVWQIFDFEKFKTISNIQLLDIKANPVKGKLIR